MNGTLASLDGTGRVDLLSPCPVLVILCREGVDGIMFIEIENETTVYAVAVLMGDYSTIRKQAAVLILKHHLGADFFKFLLEDKDLYPYSRGDHRVKLWTDNVIAAGVCELCGSTQNLEAHHRIKWVDYPQGRIDENNGQCLCLACHVNEHIDDPSYFLMAGKARCCYE
jgi:hypothetical protein